MAAWLRQAENVKEHEPALYATCRLSVDRAIKFHSVALARALYDQGNYREVIRGLLPRVFADPWQKQAYLLLMRAFLRNASIHSLSAHLTSAQIVYRTND
jgi:DNA-binding SARP family transcriptional activator